MLALHSSISRDLPSSRPAGKLGCCGALSEKWFFEFKVQVCASGAELMVEMGSSKLPKSQGVCVYITNAQITGSLWSLRSDTMY